MKEETLHLMKEFNGLQEATMKKLDNLEAMEKFLETCNLPRPN